MLLWQTHATLLLYTYLYVRTPRLECDTRACVTRLRFHVATRVRTLVVHAVTHVMMLLHTLLRVTVP